MWIVLITTLALALVFGILQLADKKRGDKDNLGILETMAMFKATSSVDSMQRRIR